MANPLLERAAPDYLARRKQVIEIVEEISTFDRLAAIVEQDLGALDDEQRPPDWRNTPVSMVVQFGFADARDALPLMRGEASVVVPAVCQRCLGVCEVPVAVTFRLLLLAETSTRAVDEDQFEIWELEDSTVRPLDIIEELLVMALPMAAMHADAGDCGGLGRYTTKDVRTDDTVRPFAGLKDRLDRSR